MGLKYVILGNGAVGEERDAGCPKEGEYPAEKWNRPWEGEGSPPMEPRRSACGWSRRSPGGRASEQGPGFAFHHAADEQGIPSDGVPGLYHRLAACHLDFQDAPVPGGLDVGGKSAVLHRGVAATLPDLDMDGAALQVDGQPGQIGQGLQGRKLQGGDIQLPKITAFLDAEGFQHLADARLRQLIVALDVDDPDPSRQELQQQRIDEDAGGEAGPCP